jgi:phi13 family phage major tail protein
MATKIGCDHLVFAPITKDDGLELTFGAITALPGVMKITINPNASQDTLFSDDGPSDTASTLGQIEVGIDKAALAIDEKASLLGHSVDAKGALVYGANDVPPWVAIGFRTLKSNGKYRYVWLYKGKFMEPEDNSETKGDSINFQNDTITGKFVKVNKEINFTVGVGPETKKTQPWKSEMDEDSATADAATIAAWFDTVYVPAAPAA